MFAKLLMPSSLLLSHWPQRVARLSSQAHMDPGWSQRLGWLNPHSISSYAGTLYNVHVTWTVVFQDFHGLQTPFLWP